MRFLIDGYNLLFRTLDFREQSLEKQRAQVIPFLWDLFEGTTHHIDVVFDADPKNFFSINNHRDPPFHLLFSPPPLNADKFILEICHGAQKKELTVVSSDKHLLASVKELSIPILTVEDFLALFRMKKNKKKRLDKPQITQSKEKIAKYIDIFEKRANDPKTFEDL
jgi:predicted RNA-binding protein with PIN domain